MLFVLLICVHIGFSIFVENISWMIEYEMDRENQYYEWSLQ